MEVGRVEWGRVVLSRRCMLEGSGGSRGVEGGGW